MICGLIQALLVLSLPLNLLTFPFPIKYRKYGAASSQQQLHSARMVELLLELKTELVYSHGE